MSEIKELDVKKLLEQLKEWEDESDKNEKQVTESTIKDKSILVRLSAQEYGVFEKKLRSSGLKQMTYARRKLLEEPIYGRVQKELIAANTCEIIRIKNSVADLTMLLVTLLEQKTLSPQAEKILVEEVRNLETTRAKLHETVRMKWQF